MKNNLRLLLSFAGLSLLATPFLRADDTPPPAPPADRPHGGHEHREEMREHFKKMVQELNLTPDQQTKGEAILKQSAEARKALWDDTSLSQEDKREKMKELRKSTEDQIHALLTPDQQAKAKEMREKHHPQGQPPAGQPTPDKPTGT